MSVSIKDPETDFGDLFAYALARASAEPPAVVPPDQAPVGGEDPDRSFAEADQQALQAGWDVVADQPIPARAANSSLRSPTARREPPLRRPTAGVSRSRHARRVAPRLVSPDDMTPSWSTPDSNRATRVVLLVPPLNVPCELRRRRAAEALGARFVLLDVTSDESVNASAADVEAHEGDLDLLINNAGLIGSHVPSDELTGEDAERVLQTNLISIVRVTHAFLPLLRSSATPAVINVSSAMGSFAATHDPDRIAALHRVQGCRHHAHHPVRQGNP